MALWGRPCSPPIRDTTHQTRLTPIQRHPCLRPSMHPRAAAEPGHVHAHCPAACSTSTPARLSSITRNLSRSRGGTACRTCATHTSSADEAQSIRQRKNSLGGGGSAQLHPGTTQHSPVMADQGPHQSNNTKVATGQGTHQDDHRHAGKDELATGSQGAYQGTGTSTQSHTHSHTGTRTHTHTHSNADQVDTGGGPQHGTHTAGQGDYQETHNPTSQAQGVVLPVPSVQQGNPTYAAEGVAQSVPRVQQGTHTHAAEGVVSSVPHVQQATHTHNTAIKAVGRSVPRAHQEVTFKSLMRGRARVTHAASLMWSQVVCPGDTVVDATCGKGYDTLALARLVGPTGTVYALDVQQSALDATQQRLNGGLSQDSMPRVELMRLCHSKMGEMVGSGVASCVVFNLGYLPGPHDQQVKTNTDTTVAAVKAALGIVNLGGMVSLLLYAHEEGLRETEAVRQLAADLSPDDWIVSELRLLNRPLAPVMLTLWRRDMMK